VTNTNDLLSQGVAALKAGQRAEARTLLQQVIKQDKQNEMAWLWLSGAVDTDKERRICLQRVLAINPSNEVAQRGLQHLGLELTTSSQAQQRIPPKKAQPLPISANQREPSGTKALESELSHTAALKKRQATKKCPHCAEDVRPEAKICPHCGKQLQGPGAMAAVGTLLFGLILIFGAFTGFGKLAGLGDWWNNVWLLVGVGCVVVGLVALFKQ
jgi:hypothetical protein